MTKYLTKKGTREIETDHDKAFVASVLEDIEKELVSDTLDELYCKDPKTANHQNTDSYKKEFEEFYNAGHGYIHLLPTEREMKTRITVPLQKTF